MAPRPTGLCLSGPKQASTDSVWHVASVLGADIFIALFVSTVQEAQELPFTVQQDGRQFTMKAFLEREEWASIEKAHGAAAIAELRRRLINQKDAQQLLNPASKPQRKQRLQGCNSASKDGKQ
eukprot:TRINITY_DN6629_c1_g1_i1.p2 TRINITY_DN6629_c1_g1~~TRINITY_DN6629_c1_g1_i1.p2  ORF type:complete len:123 (+),score=27.62 TRINITY_DN6629_c1_g1_i1:157-525(+)